MSNKEIFVEKYQEFHQELENTVSELATLYGFDERFRKIRDSFASLIKDDMSQARREATESLENTVWDRLVIAFFGETNAGKSTIVETFRILFNEVHREKERQRKGEGTDGEIVGNGQSDWTKFTTDYEMSIHNQPFTLIDVPGIEGEESKYLEQIRMALNRAHVIFYVQGNNKRPDEGTAGKIKLYLKDWVNVYSINNVKSNTEKYGFDEKARQTLFTDDIKELDKIVERAFKQNIPENYKGNITIQALLALCSVADFAPSNISMIKKQKKLQDFFGKKETVFAFSNFGALTNLVYQMASNFQEEIVESNKHKLFSLYQRTCDNLTARLKAEKDDITEYRHELEYLKKQINSQSETYKSYLSSEIENRIDISVAELQRAFIKCVLMDISEDKIKENIRIQKLRISKQLDDDVRNIIDKDLSDYDKKNHEAFANCTSIKKPTYIDQLPVRSYNMHIDLKDIPINLDFSFGHSIKETLENMVGGLEWFILKKIMKAFSIDSKKTRLIRHTSKKFDQIKTILLDSARKDIAKPVQDQISKKGTYLQDSVGKELHNIDELCQCVQSMISKTKDFQKNIKSKGYGQI